ncbi:hypothetical protein NE462_27910, partial [Blautia hominis]|nr:hypothetical protein [Blautia hominis]
SFIYSKTDDPYISFANFALAIGGMLKTDPRGNIVTQLKYTPEQIEKRKARRKITIPVGAVVGVLVLASLIFLGYTSISADKKEGADGEAVKKEIL